VWGGGGGGGGGVCVWGVVGVELVGGEFLVWLCCVLGMGSFGRFFGLFGWGVCIFCVCVGGGVSVWGGRLVDVLVWGVFMFMGGVCGRGCWGVCLGMVGLFYGWVVGLCLRVGVEGCEVEGGDLGGVFVELGEGVAGVGGFWRWCMVFFG